MIFGPVVRSHAFDLPKKVRRLALKTALSAKQAEGKLVVLDNGELDGAQDQGAGRALREARLDLGADHRRRRRSTRISPAPRATCPSVDVLPQQGANVYDILRRDTLVLTRDAVQHLEARLK